jgi:transcriptional regulator with XRE-family HTH domain
MSVPMNDFTGADTQTPRFTETHLIFKNNRTENFSLDKIDSVEAENSEDTIRRILSSYELGRKLRQLRLRKKIALVDLGRHTGLSASMLSQLENGKLVPTLPTLARIAMVFDVSLDHFFGNNKRKGLFSMVRSAERIRFPERPDAPKPAYFFECLAFSTQDKEVQAYLAEFPKRDAADVAAHFHDGAEFLHLLEGAVSIRYEDEDHILKPGDSVYFNSSEPHSYQGLSKTPARAIVITTPPRP